MSELTVGQLIKIILGVFVIVAVITGLYFAFRNNIIDFFENLPGNSSNFILGLLR